MISSRTIMIASATTAGLFLAGCSSASPTDPTTSPTSTTVTSSPSTTGASASEIPTASPNVDLARFYDQRLSWRACGGSFQCSTLTVPRDYADPQSDTFDLSVVRLRTQGKDRIGSLIVNPGGPGGSGVEYARAARAIVSEDVLAHYDLVGFDPRGVVSSDPLKCLTDKQTDAFLAADGSPDNAAEETALVRMSEQFGQDCQRRSPQIYPWMDTISAARDLDILRAAVGDEQLYYLGKSYGTFLGSTYADLFPTKVGRLVLDGVLPPDLSLTDVTLGQAISFEDSLRRFVADCLKQDFCPLPTTSVRAGVARVQSFLLSLDSKPLPAEPGRPLTQSLGLNAVLSYLYFPPSDWESLRFGLADAFAGDGSTLLAMLDQRLQRNSDGTFADNSQDAFFGVTCLDRSFDGGADEARALATQWAKLAPTFGAALAWGNLPCGDWPARAVGTPKRIAAPGAQPILVVTTTHDPATPYQWGVDLARQLDSAALVIRDGDGHTAYFDGNACVDSAVDRYLVGGNVPKADVRC